MTPEASVAAAAGIVLVGSAALAWLLVGRLGAWRLNAPLSSRLDPNFTFTPWELGLEFETVEFSAADGVDLHGWLLPRPESRRVVVAMHGYRGNKAQILGISSYLWRAGLNVLLFDFRGRGRSGAAPFSMGLWEVADLEAALDFVSGRLPGAHIGLLGYSMGGAVALLAGADPRVGSIVVDSVFPNQRAVLEHVARGDARRYLGGWIDGRGFLPAVEWWHRRSGKPPFDAIVPEAALGELLEKPILFVHGTLDATVPPALIEPLIGRSTRHEVWLVNGAAHCGAYFLDREAYGARVAAFFRRHLLDSAAAPAQTRSVASPAAEPGRG